MAEKILFSLENCPKCMQTKQLLEDRKDIQIITYPHDINKWNQEELSQSKKYNVFDDLQKTAPILWVNGEKLVGYLRIRKWLQNNKN